MKKASHKKVNLTSSNLSEEKLAELRRILPDAFSEEKIDWDKLRAVLGDNVDAGVEKFGFTWAGKSNAIKNVLIPSNATLTPASDEGVKFDESENLFIEGDNLEVLKLLQKAYFEKVKMIYIDPPYNTGGDFVYKDNFASPVKNYLEQTGQIDSEGNKLSTNKETNGRYHSDWLSMMYPRLKLAWNLLRDDGVIFVSIDDNEMHRLRLLLDEIFGEENLVGQFVWNTKNAARGVPPTTMVMSNHEYILCYAKRLENVKLRGEDRKEEDFGNPDNDPRGLWRSESIRATGQQDNHFDIKDPKTGKVFSGNWAFSKRRIDEMIVDGLILFPEDENGTPRQKKFIDSYLNDTKAIVTLLGWFSTENSTKYLMSLFGEKKVFDFPKPVELIQFLVKQASSDSDIILDFFAGSGTTAHAVMAQNVSDKSNRKWICVQLPEKTDESSEAYKAGFKTIAGLAMERIRRATNELGSNDGFKVFKLSESNYPENTFEFDPEQSESDNQKAFEEYLDRAKQNKLIDDVDETSVIYENIVKEGFSLNSNIVEGVKGDNKIYTITDGDKQFSICLDRDIKNTTTKFLADSAKNTTFICFDNALDDSAKANLGLNLELKTI
ncbi:MAG: hypothetical protein A2644_03965 [Candidatus Zambryskibacteria bacterium RIFCSPHIGHO2_01_FULL_39_63]|nr:MAG: hypothetical protein A2644_03965 [Candidatus Zambryskibacteria bacterium RIFCSPHIGHO2_01_FULL_39_63]